MMFLALAAIAAIAYAASNSSKTPEGVTVPTTMPSQDKLTPELQRLFAESGAQAYSAVLTALNSMQTPPLMLGQYAAQMAAKYPAIAQALTARFAAVVKPTTGKSGTVWNLWTGGPAAGSTAIPVQVLLQSMPVLTYVQNGADQSTRRLLTVENGADSATVARARSDFAV